MRVALFLGSGVSYDSDLPDVHSLTDIVLTGAFRHSTDGRWTYSQGTPGDGRSLHSDITTDIQRYLRVLKGYADDYFEGHGFGEATYEDVYALNSLLRRSEFGDPVNVALPAFAREVARETVRIRERIGRKEGGPARTPSLPDMAFEAEEFIDNAVRLSLTCRGTVKGLGHVAGLAGHPLVDRLDIVTLNHDVLVETTLTERGVGFADGFGPPDRDIRWFTPDSYDREDVAVRFFKLHGSIDWHVFAGPSRTGYGVPVNVDIEHCRDESGTMYNLMREAHFLTGGHKDEYYHWNIFAEVHDRFHELLRTTDTLVMSGYGWGDNAINGRLYSWLRWNPQNRIVLLREDSEVSHRSRSITVGHFGEWTRTGQLVQHRAWLSGTTPDEMLDLVSRPTQPPH